MSSKSHILMPPKIVGTPSGFPRLSEGVEHGLVVWQSKQGHRQGTPRRICPSTHQEERSSCLGIGAKALVMPNGMIKNLQRSHLMLNAIL